MVMTKEMWYKMLGKEDVFNKNKLNEVEDPTDYVLDLGKNNTFKFNKKTKTALFTKGNKSLIFDLAELKKILNFAKKNGAI